MNFIKIVTALITNDDGKVLLVRKRGTSSFMQPGGKIDAGETPVEALKREISEELGMETPTEEYKFLGEHECMAANEPQTMIRAALFHVPYVSGSSPQAEIEEIVWIDPVGQSDVTLAPYTKNIVLPISRKLLAGSEIDPDLLSG